MQRGGTSIGWLIKAGWLIAVLLAVFAVVPNAMAHGGSRAGAGSAGAEAEGGTAFHIRSTGSPLTRGDESCPIGSEGHAAHIGCCGGAVSCSTGCGVALAAEEAPQLFAPRAELVSRVVAAIPGIGTVPADPPPRAAI